MAQAAKLVHQKTKALVHCDAVQGFLKVSFTPKELGVDLLTDLERTSDHCSNVAGCVIDAGRHNLNLHETLRAAQTQDPDYAGRFRAYAQEYCLPEGE